MYKFLIFIGIIIYISIKYYTTLVYIINLCIFHNIYILSSLFFISISYKWLKKKGVYNNDILDMMFAQKTQSYIPIPKMMPFQKRNVTPITKKIIASNQQWKCAVCSNVMDYTYEIDLNIPLNRGGTNDMTNLIALCRNCHGKKTILEKIIS